MRDEQKARALRDERGRLINEAEGIEANIEQLKKDGHRKQTIDRAREQLQNTLQTINQKTHELASLQQLSIFN